MLRHYAMAQADDTINIFTEYVSGGSLDRLLKTFGPLPPGTVANYAGQVAAGLAYLHEHRIVHRFVSWSWSRRSFFRSLQAYAAARSLSSDIKGANVLLDMTHGLVKLADFGAAAHMSVHACQRPPTTPDVAQTGSLTCRLPRNFVPRRSRCVAPTCSRRCRAL